jgi:hypothetical protein
MEHETKTQIFRYKDFFIRPASYQLRSGGWVPEVTVSWQNGSVEVELPPIHPSSDETYSTCEEANQLAIALAKKWVDEEG